MANRLSSTTIIRRKKALGRPSGNSVVVTRYIGYPVILTWGIGRLVREIGSVSVELYEISLTTNVTLGDWQEVLAEL